MYVYRKITHELKKDSSKETAQQSARFFKTGKGQYGEGDKFIGVRVPDQRRVGKKFFRDVGLGDIAKLLDNTIHEYRLTGLILLTYQYEVADDATKKQLYLFYKKNVERINNWDLVDTSAPKIFGDFILSHSQYEKDLYTYARSQNMWKRRIAIVGTYAFIRAKKFSHTLMIAEMLLGDTHDLMHKSVGWMLREVGKQDKKVLIFFLDTHAQEMPRTMLRYSLEKLSVRERQHYMKK